MQEVAYLLRIMRLRDHDFCKLCLLIFWVELNQGRSSSCPNLQSYFPYVLSIAVLGLPQNDQEWEPIRRSLFLSLVYLRWKGKYSPDYIKIASFLSLNICGVRVNYGRINLFFLRKSKFTIYAITLRSIVVKFSTNIEFNRLY